VAADERLPDVVTIELDPQRRGDEGIVVRVLDQAHLECAVAAELNRS
jgi:hypothetical protein